MEWSANLQEDTTIRCTKPCGRLVVLGGQWGGQAVSRDSLLRFSHHVISTFRRLYGCLRLACGWILWHARPVDDGRFRKHICEALFVCYVLQALAVLRAQFTDRHSLINWIAIVLLSILAAAYGSFRFRKGGNLIKIYELPTGANLR